MKTKIICTKVDFETQAFYAVVGKKKYFLFEQEYSNSVREFFKNGYYLDNVDYSKIHSSAVKHTLEKLPNYIKYIENEFNVEIYNKTRRKNQGYSAKRILKHINYYTAREVLEYAYA